MNLTYRKNAKYAFTLNEEFEKTVKLLPKEKIVYRAKVRLYSPFVFARAGYLVLTSKRVAVVKHYLFRPDILVSVGLNDIEDVELRKTALLNGLFPFKRFFYIKIHYKHDNTLSIYEYSGFRRWRPVNRKTVALAKKLAVI